MHGTALMNLIFRFILIFYSFCLRFFFLVNKFILYWLDVLKKLISDGQLIGTTLKNLMFKFCDLFFVV
jgi:hypothetical protein